MDFYIGIYDVDALYARRLMSGLLAEAEVKCRTVEFTKIENVMAFAENHALELVLIAEEAYSPDLKCERIGRIIALCEKKPTAESLAWAEEQGIGLIFKYQAVQKLSREIFGVGKNTASDISEKRLIAIYSPVHRCGKTLFSLAVAQILGEKYPVLFISMDEFSAMSEIVGAGTKYDVIDALYYYIQGEIKEKEKQLIISWGNIDMLAPSKRTDDIRGIKDEEFFGFVRYFLSESIYSYVVVDIGDLPDTARLISKFDKIYMPVIKGKYNNEKLNAFKEYIFEKGMIFSEQIREIELQKVEWEDILGDAGLEFNEEYRVRVRSIINEVK